MRIATIVLVLLMAGCARNVILPDGTKIPKDIWMAQQQQQQALSLADKFAGAFQACDAEMTEIEAVSCNNARMMAMVLLPQLAQAMQTDGYWQLKAAKWQFFGNVVAGPGTALTGAIAHRIMYGDDGAVGNGGTIIKNRTQIGDGNSFSNSGDSVAAAAPGGAGGSGGAGGMAAGGPGGVGGAGASAPGVSGNPPRGIQIGTVGSNQFSERVNTGIASDQRSIQFGEGFFNSGRNPQNANAPDSAFAPVNDADEPNVGIPADLF